MTQRIGRLEWDAPTYGNDINSLASDVTYLYVSVERSGNNPFHLYRIMLSTFTKDMNYLDLGDVDSEIRNCYHSLVLDGFLYLAVSRSGSNKGSVVKVNLSSWSLVGQVIVDDNYPLALAVKGNYLYAQSVYRLEKIDLSSFTLVDGIQLSNLRTREVINISNSIAYIGCHSTPLKVERINLTSFTYIDVITFPVGSGGFAGNGGHIGAIEGNYLYYVHSDGGGYEAKVSKTELPDVTSTEYLSLEGVSSQLYGLCIDYEKRRLYCGDGSAPMKIWEINIDSWEVVEQIRLETGEDYVMALVVQSGYLYVSNVWTGAKVIKIDLQYPPPSPPSVVGKRRVRPRIIGETVKVFEKREEMVNKWAEEQARKHK